MLADVDADLGHGSDRERVQRPSLMASAHDLEPTLADGTQITLGHLAARRIVRAEEEDSRRLCVVVHLSCPVPYLHRNVTHLS
jgi:hypothetical protein